MTYYLGMAGVILLSVIAGWLLNDGWREVKEKHGTRS